MAPDRDRLPLGLSARWWLAIDAVTREGLRCAGARTSHPERFRRTTPNSSASKKKFAVGVAWSETVAEAALDVSKRLVRPRMKARSSKRSTKNSATEIRSYTALRKEVLLGFQTEYVWQLLIVAEGNVSQAARLAKIDRKHLWRLIRKTGIRIERQERE